MAVRTILGAKRRQHHMDTLVVDGVTITDPVDITNRVTAVKKRWFQPPDEDPIDWATVLASESAFAAHAAIRGVPTPLADIIWQSYNKYLWQTDALRLFQSSVINTPTYEEWETE